MREPLSFAEITVRNVIVFFDTQFVASDAYWLGRRITGPAFVFGAFVSAASGRFGGVVCLSMGTISSNNVFRSFLSD